MDTHEERLQRFQQYLEGAYSPDELGELLAYFDEATDSSALKQKIETYLAAPETFDEATTQRIDQITAQTDGYIRQLTQPAHTISVRRPHWKKPLSIAAAAVLVMLSISLYFYINKSTVDIPPGYNQATLTLADGTKITLDSAQSGIIIGNEHIKYQSGASLPGVILSGEGGKEKGGAEGSLPAGKNGAETRSTPPDISGSAQGDVLLALSTPKGGQYQIILSDGTKVWLNAASTLKYPSKFTGDKREVFLEGEGYFEVNNKASAGSRVSCGPFIVKSKNQEILVLGTSFNVTAYAEELTARTTLISGAIKVASNVASEIGPYALKLVPGEQSLIQKDGKISKAHVDVNNELAWRNGLISFNNEPLETIMKKIARWYNVDIIYQGADKSKRFGGNVSRYANVSQVLRKLALTGGVHFNIEGRQIFVKP
ncbi:FecR family protein [bacterium A37T11]|nr:FecR family protein [bacterium A37T11]